MKKGILISLLYFGIGFGIAGIFYAVIGHPYIHAPGVHHLIILLTLIIGIIVTITSIGIFFLKAKSDKLKGIIVTNSIIILSCFLYVAIPIYIDSQEKTTIKSETVHSEIKGDTTKLYHNEKLIYMKVNDSIIIDFE